MIPKLNTHFLRLLSNCAHAESSEEPLVPGYAEHYRFCEVCWKNSGEGGGYQRDVERGRAMLQARLAWLRTPEGRKWTAQHQALANEAAHVESARLLRDLDRRHRRWAEADHRHHLARRRSDDPASYCRSNPTMRSIYV